MRCSSRHGALLAGRSTYGGSLHVFVRGTDNRPYQNSLSGDNWNGWREVPGGGRTPSGPAIIAFGGRLYLFVRGTDNGIYTSVRRRR